jgi:hypothetical protein
MPVEFQVDERDDLPRFACGNQDHPAIAGTPVLLLGIPASGNPRLHLFSRVIRPGHVADGAVEDIGHAGGIPPLIIPDGYFHHPQASHEITVGVELEFAADEFAGRDYTARCGIWPPVSAYAPSPVTPAR